MASEVGPDRLIGEVLASRYRVEARLGGGAMGTIYLARHVKVGRAFAIKVLRPCFLSDDNARKRFAREAELAGSLQHPNVVSVVDVGETRDGLRYLVMELADGTTLFDLVLSAAPMPGARVISIVRQLCDGLQHAHERGLIHRDFKPENVIIGCDALGRDVVKILDFGIAILRDDAGSSGAGRLTTAGVVLGTPHYMSPEHATGGEIDHRIDLFALGVMCFEMLTGRPPFDGDGVDVARANLLLDTPEMSVRVPGLIVDPLLEALTRRLMMKSRDARPATAKAVRELVDLIERDRPAAAAALGGPFGDHGPAAVTHVPELPPAHGHPRPPTSGVARPWHLAAAASGYAPADLTAPRFAGETERIMPTRKRRAGLAMTAAAGLVVLVALVLALRPQRPVASITPARSPAPTLAATRSIDAATADPPAPPAPIATVPDPAPGEPAARTIAKPPRLAARTSVATKPVPPPEKPVIAPRPPAVAADPPAPTVDLAPPPRNTDAATPSEAPRVAVSASQPPPSSPPAVPASAATVARLYARVGKELKALDDARGSAATADLWLLYLRVRINDVIADPVKCAEADTLLHHLDDQIVQRSR